MLDEIEKVVVTISKGFHPGDNLMINGPLDGISVRRVRLENKRPVLIFEQPESPRHFRPALEKIHFTYRRGEYGIRTFGLSIFYHDGSGQMMTLAQYAPSKDARPPHQKEIDPDWIYDDADFDLYLFSIMEAGNKLADFLPEPQSIQINPDGWSATIEPLTSAHLSPHDQPIGLLTTDEQQHRKAIDHLLPDRLDEIDW